MRARTMLAASVTVIALATLAAVLWPRRTPPVFPLDDDERAAFQTAAAEYDKLPLLHLSPSDAAPLHGLLTTLPLRPPPAPTAQVPDTLPPSDLERHAADLRDLYARLLFTAILADEPDAYVAWRRSRGDRPDAHPHTGEPIDESEFRDIWAATLADRNPDTRITAVAASPALAQLWYQNAHMAWAPPEPPEGEPFWTGARLATAGSLWTSGVGRADLLERDGAVLRARIGVIVTDAANRRYPLILHAFWLPELGRWSIDFLHIGNAERPEDFRIVF